jgi:hypothetical protein
VARSEILGGGPTRMGTHFFEVICLPRSVGLPAFDPHPLRGFAACHELGIRATVRRSSSACRDRYLCFPSRTSWDNIPAWSEPAHATPRKDEAERHFPRKVDIPVPDNGLGRDLTAMLDWCQARVPSSAWPITAIPPDRAEASLRCTTRAGTSLRRPTPRRSGKCGRCGMTDP